MASSMGGVWNSEDDLTNNGQSPPMFMLQLSGQQTARVIGRGGQTIKRIQQDSGSRVQITSEVSRGPSTVRVTGSLAAVRKGRDLVMQEISKVNDDIRERKQKYRQPLPEPEEPPSPERSESPVEKKQVLVDWDLLRRNYKNWKIARNLRLQPMKKVLYEPSPETLSMTPAEAEQWRSDNMKISMNFVITVREFAPGDEEEAAEYRARPPPDNTPLNPIVEFKYGFSQYPELMREIEKQGFTKPSPIQAQAWPVLLSGRDLIGIAQTGTGKTLAFLLPALIHIDLQPVPRDERPGPNVLILAPTRELAQQIHKEVEKYNYKGIKAVCVYGGGSRTDQITKIQKGVQIIIATPGRLNDLVAANFIDMEGITFLVLDEADRMLDMGFEPQIRKSLLSVRPDRQTVMTSATWPFNVRNLAQTYMEHPVQVVVGSLDLTAVHTVHQELVFLDEEEKFERLVHFLKNKEADDRIIVFCGKKATTVWVASEIALMDVNFQCIYGGLDQSSREQAVEEMQQRVTDILIATDVASRGLDIDNITHVINYDFPHSMEEYVHRVGRTGRAGKEGTSITYVTRSDWSKSNELIKILEEAEQEVPDELRNMAERFAAMRLRNRGRGGGRGRGGFRGRGGYGGGFRGGFGGHDDFSNFDIN